MGIALLIFNSFNKHIMNCVYKIMPGLRSGKCLLTEEAESYWRSLDENDLMWTVAEE
jgi:hypothetical protein